MRVGRYEILEPLDRGSVRAFRAYDPALKRSVGIMFLDLQSLTPDQINESLRRATRIGSLTHPNICMVYDSGTITSVDGARNAYVVTEFATGQTLRTLVIEKRGNVLERIAWMTDVARGLAAAHDAEITYGRMRLESVFVSHAGTAKLLPPDIPRTSRIVEDRGSGNQEDTIEAHSSNVDPFAADQLAWGQIALEVFAEQVHKLEVTSAPESIEGIDRTKIEPASELSGALSHILARSLGRNRFASMHALADALQQLTRGPDSNPEIECIDERTANIGPRRGLRLPFLLIFSPKLAGAAVLAALAAGGIFQAFHGVSLSETSSAPSSATSIEACASHQSCVERHGGAPYRCNATSHECVAIESADCHAFFSPDDLEREDTTWLGGLFPLSGPGSPSGETAAAELAWHDFDQALRSSFGRNDELRARPLALLVCDEAESPARAARHLAEDVEVPAVLGFRWSKTAMETIPAIFSPRNVLSMVTISTVPEIMQIPEPSAQPRLIWRTTLNGADVAIAMSRLVSEYLEPKIRRARPEIRSLRVALLRPKKSATDRSDALFRSLRFNGRTAIENGDNFRQFVVDDVDSGATLEVARDLARFNPHIVLMQVSRSPLLVLKALLAAQTRKPWMPYFITPSYYDRTALEFIGSDPERRRHFIGITNATATMPNAQLVLHYNAAHPEAPVTRADAPQPSYDAFYLLAYAAESIDQGDVTGPALARGFSRLIPPGLQVDVGPRSILEGFRTLRRGENIDLNGAIGPLDFDVNRGEAPIDYAFLCIDVDDHGFAAGAVESGMFYNSGSGALRGTMHCP